MRGRLNRVAQVAALLVLAGTTGCGSESPDDDVACLNAIVNDQERAALNAAEEIEDVVERLPSDKGEQRQAMADLRGTADRLRSARGECV